jgi:hypothetical protein
LIHILRLILVALFFLAAMCVAKLLTTGLWFEGYVTACLNTAFGIWLLGEAIFRDCLQIPFSGRNVASGGGADGIIVGKIAALNLAEHAENPSILNLKTRS